MEFFNNTISTVNRYSLPPNEQGQRVLLPEQSGFYVKEVADHLF